MPKYEQRDPGDETLSDFERGLKQMTETGIDLHTELVETERALVDALGRENEQRRRIEDLQRAFADAHKTSNHYRWALREIRKVLQNLEENRLL